MAFDGISMLRLHCSGRSSKGFVEFSFGVGDRLAGQSPSGRYFNTAAHSLKWRRRIWIIAN